jgi:hypothetical protein
MCLYCSIKSKTRYDWNCDKCKARYVWISFFGYKARKTKYEVKEFNTMLRALLTQCQLTEEYYYNLIGIKI